jgi:hypothetical protein
MCNKTFDHIAHLYHVVKKYQEHLYPSVLYQGGVILMCDASL